MLACLHINCYSRGLWGNWHSPTARAISVGSYRGSNLLRSGDVQGDSKRRNWGRAQAQSVGQEGKGRRRGIHDVESGIAARDHGT